MDSCQVDFYGQGWILARFIVMAGSGFLLGLLLWQGVDSCQVDCYCRGWILAMLIVMTGGGFFPG